MMGVKVIFVAFFSYILKPDEVPALIWIGSILAAAAIFLLGGASLKGFKENSKTVFWSLLACACFGGSDTLAGYRSSEFGEIPFIVIMVTVVAVLSILMIPFFLITFKILPKKSHWFCRFGRIGYWGSGIDTKPLSCILRTSDRNEHNLFNQSTMGGFNCMDFRDCTRE